LGFEHAVSLQATASSHQARLYKLNPDFNDLHDVELMVQM
jgi:hypothetical protein